MLSFTRNGNYSHILLKQKNHFSIIHKKKKICNVIQHVNSFSIINEDCDISNKEMQYKKIIEELNKGKLKLKNVIKNNKKDLIKEFEDKLSIIYKYTDNLYQSIENIKTFIPKVTSFLTENKIPEQQHNNTKSYDILFPLIIFKLTQLSNDLNLLYSSNTNANYKSEKLESYLKII